MLVYHTFSQIFIFCILSSVRARPQNINKTTRILNHSKNFSLDDYFDEQEIIFPDSYEGTDEVPDIDGVPTCAQGKYFCEHYHEYPHKYVKEMLKKTNFNKNLFGSDEPHDEITNRIGEVDEEFICTSTVKTIFPKVGKTKNNKWKFIINQGLDGYIQGVNVEICKRPNGPCDLLKDAPYGIITHCRQKYAYRRLISLGNQDAPSVDNFLMPTACCCSYRKDLQFLARFAAGTKFKT